MRALINAWHSVRAPQTVAIFKNDLSEYNRCLDIQYILSFDGQSNCTQAWDLRSENVDSKILHLSEPSFPYL